MNALIISHYFYPYLKVSAKRMTALAVFLHEKGHNVWVVHGNEMEYQNSTYSDKILLSDIEIIELKKFYINPIKRKFLRPIQYWCEVKNIIEDNAIDVVFISSGPFNYLSIIPKIKKYWPNIKCVLDFRDVLDGADNNNNKKGIYKKVGYLLDLYTERNAVKVADLVMTVTESMNIFYKKRYPKHREKFINIMNGYDDITTSYSVREEIKQFTSYKKENASYLTVGVFGKFGWYDHRYYDLFGKVLTRLHKNNIHIRLRQYGYEEIELKKSLQINEKNCYEYVESKGYEKDILDLQRCDVAIATNYSKEALGTKIFDYIFINRPIIVLNPYIDGEMNRLVSRFKNGYPCTNEEDVYEAIVELSEKKILMLSDDIKDLKCYGRRYQFSLLYEYLQNC